MDIIDFEGLFKESLKPLILSLSGDESRLEALWDSLPDRYREWLELKNESLGGVSPARYFDSLSACELADHCREYALRALDVPDVLVSALTNAGDEDVCLALLRDCALSEEMYKAADAAIEALVHMDSDRAAQQFIAYVQADVHEALKQRAAEALIALGEAGGAGVAEALGEASPSAAPYLADVAAQLGLTEAVPALIELFRRSYEHRAFYAACLGRLGDARALTVLRQALGEDDDYLSYLAVLHAYEELGEVVDVSRAFDEDAGALMVDELIQLSQFEEEG